MSLCNETVALGVHWEDKHADADPRPPRLPDRQEAPREDADADADAAVRGVDPEILEVAGAARRPGACVHARVGEPDRALAAHGHQSVQPVLAAAETLERQFSDRFV